jgi:hypothetical protein
MLQNNTGHKMITAKEANQLYDESGAEVAEFLKHKIDGLIRAAASAGKKKATIHLSNDRIYAGGMNRAHAESLASTIDKLVVAKLIELGYTAQIQPIGVPYIPAGLVDDFDSSKGTTYQDYGIVIGW